MRKTIVYIATLLSFSLHDVRGEVQCAPPDPLSPPKTALDHFGQYFSIRKSFVGTKDEKQPASLSFASASEGDDYYNVDFAIKHRGIDCSAEGEHLVHQLLLFPSGEWHRSSITSAETNKVTASGNAEYYVRRVAGKFMPFVLLKPSLTRDIQKDTTASTITLHVSGKSLARDRRPGAAIRRESDDALIARYYPYAGLEYHRNLAITTGLVRAAELEATFAIARLYLEWYPLNNTPDEGQFQILADAAFRHRFAGDDGVPKSPWIINSSATYYFDPELRFGLGYEFEVGRNPLNNFERLRVQSLNLKLRL